MSTCKANNYQIGQSLTASQNFVWYQPSTPDGTVRLGNGNSGSVSDVITVGTTGSLTFANSVSLSAASTKTLTLNGGAGSNGLVLDASNNVGIGTGSPAAKLNVESTTTPQFKIVNTGVITWGLSAKSDTNLGVVVNSTEVGTWSSSGNLGLGVTPSAWGSNFRALQIGPAASFATYNGTGSDVRIYCNAFLNSSSNPTYIQSSLGAGAFQIANNEFRWYTAPSGTAGNAISFTQAMTLDASGNLLVGTTSSSARLVVSQSADAGTFFVENTNSTVTANILDVRASRNTTAGSFRALAYYNTGAGAYKFYVIDGGNLYSTSATVNVISDQRLKENVRDLDTGLKEILALRPRRFDWKENQGDGSKDTPGFIAQEVEQVMPELVVPWNVTGTEADDHKGLATGNLIPTLVKAIQELSAELNELKQRIN